MRRKAQVIIISLWILVFLSILALGIGHRVSLALRLSRYQKDMLKASYLAKAGLNWAIKEIINDQTPLFDSLNDNWADNEEIFKKIMIKEDQNEFATVNYIIDEGDVEKIKYGILDEERKININTADLGMLKSLLSNCDLPRDADSEALAKNILAWRGGVACDSTIYEGRGYSCKGDKFVNIEELTLVKGITSEIYRKIKWLITVYGDGKININTVDSKVLGILIKNCVKPPTVIDTDVLLAQILLYREMSPFKDNVLTTALNMAPDNIEFSILEELEKLIVVKSRNFHIISIGKIANSNLTRVRECVYDRDSKKIIWQHEN